MEFKINKDHFSNGLQQVLNVVGTRSAMPILGNVLIEASADHISLTTTNLDIGIRCRITAEVTTEGSITLPVRKLATIVKELPQQEVFFELASNNQAKITSGGSIFKVMGIGTDEFPPLPSFENQHVFKLEQNDLANMLKSVSFAQSSDENRYILNGVYFNFSDENLTLVATDGRRLALTSYELEADSSDTGSLILPAKTVSEIERLVGKGESVKIAFNDRQVAFEIAIEDEEGNSGLIDHIYLVSKIVEGNFPNYRQVIPKETEHRIKIERELFLECVHRAALVTSEKSNSIKLKISNNLMEIMGSSAEYGESHESMGIAYEGPDVQIAFNPTFLMEPLRALSHDEIFFEFKDELSPGLVKTLNQFLCVIMPLRLN
ncbi:MAG: DNA polymerase III subunit beta [Puniceicoccaceae bacterium MED-G32]|jgi:DNA polymerase-3 subunit beta|nr:DNA polymerase III subunit beta [Puniceicoccaceae bacterium]CAI8279119.1 MAG: DNA polymerase III subunit beta [Puniceicoccaceae bacterium MED-G32]|tara:strand:- start:728 stop:1858 length:1131 start_codon:yes stop_codon:yes gene_type:complete